MKFTPIDWNIYNRPPYLPQWLSKGETKAFTSFDDSQLVKVEGQIRQISEQYDIDNAKAMLLDRIGNILAEPRNGNDDYLYRLLLKLRSLLNTTNGSVNDIIKVIKFIYSSEIINITPNYPAAISILHDGEAPSIDFNRILFQVIGAGIGYDTRELFYFTENIVITDNHLINIRRNVSDSATQVVYRNGRVLRDGKTIYDTHVAPLFRDGSVLRNGSVLTRDGTYRAPSEGTIYPPIYRRSGPQDVFSLTFGRNFVDEHYSNLYRNGAVVRDGTVKRRDGKAPYSVNDSLNVLDQTFSLYDSQTVTEVNEIISKTEVAETINRNLKRDGTIIRNGNYYRQSEGIIDPFLAQRNEEPEIDLMETIDSFAVGIRNHYFRNGGRIRDGTILRNGNILIPLE